MRTIRTMAAAALIALALPAAPAAATHEDPRCAGILTSGPDYWSALVCVTARGVYDPVTVSCNAIYGCWARVTAGTHDSASVDAEICFDSPHTEELCVTAGSGELPLVPVPPQTVCVNDSPWGPPCEPHDG
ncbi:MAG TPA: hypothetical protein VHN37_11280 [Actinomycetota bacterium]|nr:hypothetical protein [Actinomycetota bacterium]